MLFVGLNRPEKRNAFNMQMIRELGSAYGEIENDPEIWVGVVFAHGEHFTGGLDLADVAGSFGDFDKVVPEGGLDPWRNDGTRWTTPVIVAARGMNYTAGIELMLAADIRVAASDSKFLQFEVQRGIFPFGGAMTRFVREAGWGNAMRWILTGEDFGADEALRLGLIQEITEPGEELARATEIAEYIADALSAPGCPGRAAHGTSCDRRGPRRFRRQLHPRDPQAVRNGGRPGGRPLIHRTASGELQRQVDLYSPAWSASDLALALSNSSWLSTPFSFSSLSLTRSSAGEPATSRM